MTRIVTNKLLNPTRRVIENYKQDFRTSDGPNNSAFISLSDLAIPCDSHYTSRIVLPAGVQNYYLNYGLLENITFLLIKVTYNGNYDIANEDDYDPYYFHEPETYSINYYFEGNSGITYPIGRLLVLNGSFTNKLTKIYINNPLDYDVVLDVFHADISAPIPISPSSAVTISNLYYTDVLTDQITCNSGITGSTQFILNEFNFNMTGYTINRIVVPYSTIIDIQKDIALKTIYLTTLSIFYKLKFLTEFDCNQAYSRILFAFSSYTDGSCRYLTIDDVYKNGSPIICSGYTGVDISSPVIYYNSGSTWIGSGTTVPSYIRLKLYHDGLTGWTIDSLKYLFINQVVDCFDGVIPLSEVSFKLYKRASVIELNGIYEEGLYDAIISITDNANNTIINYITI